MLPGPLEHPFGLERRLLSPPGYRGAVIGTTLMPLARLSRALHAVPRAYRPADLPPWRYTGAELDLVSLAEGGRYPVYGKSSVTANVAFWPAAATIIGNREVLERLTAADRRILAHAARESLRASVAQLQAERIVRQFRRFVGATTLRSFRRRRSMSPRCGLRFAPSTRGSSETR